MTMIGSVILCRKDQQITTDTLTTNVGIRATDPVTPTLRIEDATIVTKWAISSTSVRRLEDREKGIDRPIAQRNAKKICTNCGKNNHSVQDCRKPKDYKPGTAYDGLPYQTVDRRTYNTNSGYENNTMENLPHSQYQGN